MQVIYHWAFAVAPALCPPVPPTLKSGGGHVPLLDIWPRRLCPSIILHFNNCVLSARWRQTGRNGVG